jgi:hypothetical protein
MSNRSAAAYGFGISYMFGAVGIAYHHVAFGGAWFTLASAML